MVYLSALLQWFNCFCSNWIIPKKNVKRSHIIFMVYKIQTNEWRNLTLHKNDCILFTFLLLTSAPFLIVSTHCHTCCYKSALNFLNILHLHSTLVQRRTSISTHRLKTKTRIVYPRTNFQSKFFFQVLFHFHQGIRLLTAKA